VLASAQRADMLVDFSDLPPGSELTFLNTARVPFNGRTVSGGSTGIDGIEEGDWCDRSF